MIAWTDYPLFPNERNKRAPIREVLVVSYDGDKYAVVQFESERIEIKVSYLYAAPGRISEVPTVNLEDLALLPDTDLYDNYRCA